jgi:hypothetical protein
MATDLELTCTEMSRWIGQAEALLHQPDQEGIREASGQPSSCPPWNALVAGVLLDPYEGIPRLEASLRLAVTGSLGRRRGSSHRHTEAALQGIGRFAAALGVDAEDTAQIIVTGWMDAIRRVPAIDEVAVWRTLRPDAAGLAPACRFCGSYMLRVAARSRVVQCFFPDCPGARPTATMDILLAGPEAGKPILVWSDGHIDYPPDPPPLFAPAALVQAPEGP